MHHKARIVVSFLALALVGCTSTSSFNNCSGRFYTYPFGLENHPEIIELYSESYVAGLISARKENWKESWRVIKRILDSEKDLDSLEKHEVKAVAEELFTNIDIYHYRKPYPEQFSINVVRLLEVANLFRETGESYTKSKNIDAVFEMQHLCPIDEFLTEMIANETIVAARAKTQVQQPDA